MDMARRPLWPRCIQPCPSPDTRRCLAYSRYSTQVTTGGAKWSLHKGAQEDRIQLQPQCRAHIDPPGHPAVALFNHANIDSFPPAGPGFNSFQLSLRQKVVQRMTPAKHKIGRNTASLSFQAELLPLHTWYLSQPRSNEPCIEDRIHPTGSLAGGFLGLLERN